MKHGAHREAAIARDVGAPELAGRLMPILRSMPDDEDIVEIGGVRMNRSKVEPERPSPRSRFLSVWYRCCHTYGRLYRNLEETMYVGRCPRCGAQVHALIGPNGTARRLFEAK